MIYIHAVGHFHPENVIDNQFLEDLNIGTNAEWILERVGIRERRTVLSLDYIKKTYNEHPASIGPHIQYSNAKMGALAARSALEQANLVPKQIGMIIAGGSLPQYSLPAEACLIASELNINAISFDINSACSTFAIHMHTLSQMKSESLPDYILLVISESMTRSVNFKDRSTAVLWGDGALAMVVSKTKLSNIFVAHTTAGSDPMSCHMITVPAGGHFHQEGSAVQRFAIKKTLSIIEELRKKGNIDPQSHYFIGHQANLLMLRSVCNLAKILDDQHLYNVDQFGNCGAMGAPSLLSQTWSQFTSGDVILLAVVGAGLTWGGMVIQVI